MGFDLYGRAPTSDAGKYFRNNIWWWRPLKVVIHLTCEDILTDEDLRELGFNDGHVYSAAKAEAIASRLSAIAADEKQLAECKKNAMVFLPDYYHEAWSKENIQEFVEFLKASGGFEVS
jgi:tRNA(Phe) wybutosine-synthesizing methylase Tyw3